MTKFACAIRATLASFVIIITIALKQLAKTVASVINMTGSITLVTVLVLGIMVNTVRFQVSLDSKIPSKIKIDCENHCQNGKCVIGTPGKPTCDCGLGFEGDLCEVNVCTTAKNPCLNGGKCKTEATWPYQLTCDCSGTGFHGHNCELDDCQFCPGNRNFS